MILYAVATEKHMPIAARLNAMASRIIKKVPVSK
jgi:hypothetical protein